MLRGRLAGVHRRYEGGGGGREVEGMLPAVMGAVAVDIHLCVVRGERGGEEGKVW